MEITIMATQLPPVSRRRFISMLGGGMILAAGTGVTGFALTRTPHAAIAPWLAAGQYSEPRRFALSYAILAPNPHNLQPWMVDLSEPDVVTVLADPARRLPETDPVDRQLTIGLGCFLELMQIAAAQRGYALQTTLFPMGEDPLQLSAHPVARVRFVADSGTADPLFASILQRRSAKQPFAMDRSLSSSDITVLDPGISSVQFNGTRDPERVAGLRQLIWQAFLVEYQTPAKHMESINLMRLGKSEINANPDGIDLGGMSLESLQRLGLITRKSLATPGSIAYQSGLDMYQSMFVATPAFVWLTTANNNRTDQINAGQAWLRLNLLATRAGLGLQPVSQCLQEYPEMRMYYDQVHEQLAQGGETVQMLGRLGYAAPDMFTPRWSLDEKIINT
jgi:hypothetical protein